MPVASSTVTRCGSGPSSLESVMTTHTVRECSHVMNIVMGSLEVTSRCSSRCKTCNVWRLRQSNETDRPELDRDALNDTMTQLRDLGCRLIEFHGGEPTLRRDLPELISCCTGLGMEAMFATNGLNMTEKLASELVHAGLGEIRFSLEGPRETHNHIRGREDAFDKQIEAIGMIHGADTANRVTKAINTTISSMNIHCIEKILEIAQQLHIKYVAVFLASVLGPDVVKETNEVFEEDVAYRRSLLDRELLIHDPVLIETKREQLLRRAQELDIHLNKSTFLTMPLSAVTRGIKRQPGPCWRIYRACTIASSGDVFPCEYLRYTLGNIQSQSLKDILTSLRFRQFSKTYSHNVDRLHICDYCCQSL